MEKQTKETEEEKQLFLNRRESIKKYGGHPSGEEHPFYGKRHSEETKAKIRVARSKQINTPESNKKRSETQKGRVFSEESKEKMRQHALKRFSNKKNHPNYGKPLSQNTKENISKANKGRRLQDLHTPEKAKEILSKIKLARAKQVFPLTDTSIEVKVQDFLKQLGIEFITHHHINIKYSYQCDIFIPSMNMVIECDGDYWHGNITITPISEMAKKIRAQRCLDYERTIQMECADFTVIRLLENEINNMNVDEFNQQMQNHAE